MAIGLVGRKAGMTRIFTDDGHAVPVTVIESNPIASHSAKALPITAMMRFKSLSVSAVPSVSINHWAANFAKANTEAGRGLWEFAWAAMKVLSLMSVRN